VSPAAQEPQHLKKIGGRDPHLRRRVAQAGSGKSGDDIANSRSCFLRRILRRRRSGFSCRRVDDSDSLWTKTNRDVFADRKNGNALSGAVWSDIVPQSGVSSALRDKPIRVHNTRNKRQHLAEVVRQFKFHPSLCAVDTSIHGPRRKFRRCRSVLVYKSPYTEPLRSFHLLPNRCLAQKSRCARAAMVAMEDHLPVSGPVYRRTSEKLSHFHVQF
jgi:hypothetical protein